MFLAGIQVAAKRAVPLLGIVGCVWAVFAALCVFAAGVAFERMPEVQGLLDGRALVGWAGDPAGIPDSVWQAWDDLLSADWARGGWAGVLIVGGFLLLSYLTCASVANTATAYQAYQFLVLGQRAGFLDSLRHGVRRALPGAVLLGVWYSATSVITIGLVAGAGYLAAIATGNPFIVVGVCLLGAMLSITAIIFLYLHWALTSYAVALSPRPWAGFGISSSLTRGSRWLVLGRVVLISLAVALALSFVSTPLGGLGLLPGIAGLLSLLLLRALVSLISGVANGATATSMYVDLGGEVAPLGSAGHVEGRSTS